MKRHALVTAVFLSACGSPEPAPSTATAEMSLTERGAVVFRKCRTCHTLAEGDRNKVGPNLWGVFGREAGSRADFTYSKAMQNLDVIWDDAKMDAYLRKPSEYLPGGRMSFVGLKKPEDREAVIAYLREQTGAR